MIFGIKIVCSIIILSNLTVQFFEKIESFFTLYIINLKIIGLNKIFNKLRILWLEQKNVRIFLLVTLI